MALPFYFDHHIPRAVAIGLRLRSVDVLTAHEDGADQWDDSRLLDRATHLDRVLFTQDRDFLGEAAARLQKGVPFAGVIFAPQLGVSVGQCVADLELIAKVVDFEEIKNCVLYLPL